MLPMVGRIFVRLGTGQEILSVAYSMYIHVIAYISYIDKDNENIIQVGWWRIKVWVLASSE